MKFGNPEAFRLLIIVVPLLAYLGYRTLKVWRNLGLFFDKATAPKMITPLSGRMTAVKFSLTAAGSYPHYYSHRQAVGQTHQIRGKCQRHRYNDSRGRLILNGRKGCQARAGWRR